MGRKCKPKKPKASRRCNRLRALKAAATKLRNAQQRREDVTVKEAHTGEYSDSDSCNELTTVGPECTSNVLTEGPCTQGQVNNDIPELLPCNDLRRNAQQRREDVTVKEAHTGEYSDSDSCNELTAVGPECTSNVLTEAPCTQGQVNNDIPELLPCYDLRNQENTVPETEIELERGWCRCCLEQVSFKRMQFGNMNGQFTDIYADMLLETFNIAVTKVQGHRNSTLSLICSECKIRLQNAFAFKQQILEADRCLVENIESGFFNSLEENNEPKVTNHSTIVEEIHYGNDNMNPVNNDNNFCNENVSAASKKLPTRNPKSQKQKNKAPGIKCGICSKMEDNCVMMLYHVKRYHHQCNRCSKVLRNTYERVDHEQTHPPMCELCKEEFETDLLLRSHMVQVHKTRRFYTCPKCKEICESVIKFNEHKAEAHGAPKFKCGACDKIFYEKSLLSVHHRTIHMMEKKFSCTKCEYKTDTSAHLKHHMVTHSNVKLFRCQHCQKRFARANTLMYHERIHTGDKRQVCTLCGAAFVQRASLKYHLQKQHPGQL